MQSNDEQEEDYSYDDNFKEAIRIIAKNLFICVEELKDAGYTYSDFSDD